MLYCFLKMCTLNWILKINIDFFFLYFFMSLHINRFIFCTFSVKKAGGGTGRFANATLVRLSEFLSAGYKKGVRPVKDWRTSTIVAIDLMVYSILNVVSYGAQVKKSIHDSFNYYFIFSMSPLYYLHNTQTYANAIQDYMVIWFIMLLINQPRLFVDKCTWVKDPQINVCNRSRHFLKHFFFLFCYPIRLSMIVFCVMNII